MHPLHVGLRQEAVLAQLPGRPASTRVAESRQHAPPPVSQAAGPGGCRAHAADAHLDAALDEVVEVLVVDSDTEGGQRLAQRVHVCGRAVCAGRDLWGLESRCAGNGHHTWPLWSSQTLSQFRCICRRVQTRCACGPCRFALTCADVRHVTLCQRLACQRANEGPVAEREAQVLDTTIHALTEDENVGRCRRTSACAPPPPQHTHIPAT